jgi:hypothetical protein
MMTTEIFDGLKKKKKNSNNEQTSKKHPKQTKIPPNKQRYLPIYNLTKKDDTEFLKLFFEVIIVTTTRRYKW